MKKILIITLAMAVFTACGKKLPSTGTFGDQKITADGATPIAEFMTGVDSTTTEKKGKVSGTIDKVCQSKGCWFNFDLGEGKYVRIITKDHSFSIPKDAKGKKAIAEGVLKVKTTDVERQKHLAKDAGKSEEDIAKITQPKTEYEMEVTGVIISN